MQSPCLCSSAGRQPVSSTSIFMHSSLRLSVPRAVFFGGRQGLVANRPETRGAFATMRGHARRHDVITQCVMDVTQDTFEAEVLKSDKVVLVDFWAEWCGPCKLVAPLLPQIEQEFSGAIKIVKINADPCPALVEKYKVYGLPTLILFKDGKMIEGSLREGAIAKKPLLQYLEKHGLAPAAK